MDQINEDSLVVFYSGLKYSFSRYPNHWSVAVKYDQQFGAYSQIVGEVLPQELNQRSPVFPVNERHSTVDQNVGQNSERNQREADIANRQG